MAKAKKIVYSVHPAVDMVAKWIATLKEKTGKSLEEWIAFIKKNGPDDVKACRAWLKEAHGLGTNSAWWLQERAFNNTWRLWEDTPEAYLEKAEADVVKMFAGPKQALFPLYEKLVDLGRALGKDVKFCPCQTMVPFYRSRVFAQVKPSTRTRIDFGLALGDTPAKGRLIDTGGFAKKDRITHRFEIKVMEDIDEEVESWLSKAYERDAE